MLRRSGRRKTKPASVMTKICATWPFLSSKRRENTFSVTTLDQLMTGPKSHKSHFPLPLHFLSPQNQLFFWHIQRKSSCCHQDLSRGSHLRSLGKNFSKAREIDPQNHLCPTAPPFSHQYCQEWSLSTRTRSEPWALLGVPPNKTTTTKRRVFCSYRLSENSEHVLAYYWISHFSPLLLRKNPNSPQRKYQNNQITTQLQWKFRKVHWFMKTLMAKDNNTTACFRK